MSKYFYHANLTGEELHGAKVKVVNSPDPLPSPQFAGELLVYNQQLKYAYATIYGATTLDWFDARGVTAANAAIPWNVVIFQEASTNPSGTPARAGIIHINLTDRSLWISNPIPGTSGSEWVKFYDPNAVSGGSSSATFTGEVVTIPIAGYQVVTGTGNAIKFTNYQIFKEYGFIVKNQLPYLYDNIVISTLSGLNLSPRTDRKYIRYNDFNGFSGDSNYGFLQAFSSSASYLTFFYGVQTRQSIEIDYDHTARIITLRNFEYPIGYDPNYGNSDS